jgi:hypothetical protein
MARVIGDLERVAMRSRSVPTPPQGTVRLGMLGQGPARQNLARLAMAWSYNNCRHREADGEATDWLPRSADPPYAAVVELPRRPPHAGPRSRARHVRPAGGGPADRAGAGKVPDRQARLLVILPPVFIWLTVAALIWAVEPEYLRTRPVASCRSSSLRSPRSASCSSGWWAQ